MKNLIFLAAVLLLFAGCNQATRETTASADTTHKKPVVNIPEFNADSAYAYVKAQLDFGPRVPNTPAHAKCAAYLEGKLKSFIPDVIVQPGKVRAYDGTLLNFKNIIATWKPQAPNRILLCAHWDSRPFADHDPDPANHRKPVDGANDGASGVGVLLEVARVLSQSNPEIGIDIVLFDVEDYGPPQDHQTGKNTENDWGLGSQYWARNPHVKGYSARYGILLDMVGAPGATFLMEGISMEYAGDIVKKVWGAAARAGYSSYFLNEPGPYITDDHLYVNRIMGLPTIDIIHLDKNSETGFYPYWHTTGDTMDKIDRATLKAVGQTLLTVIFEEI
jgi:Zn-dependent M28 family amino/carboxypeptidase